MTAPVFQTQGTLYPVKRETPITGKKIAHMRALTAVLGMRVPPGRLWERLAERAEARS